MSEPISVSLLPQRSAFSIAGRMLYLDTDRKTVLAKGPDGSWITVGEMDGAGNVRPLSDPVPDVTVEGKP